MFNLLVSDTDALLHDISVVNLVCNGCVVQCQVYV